MNEEPNISEKIISLTGHRDLNDIEYSKLVKYLTRKILTEVPKTIISGAAIGADHAFLEAGIAAKKVYNLKVIVYEPFLDFTYKWTSSQKQHYIDLAGQADEVKIITPYILTEYWEFASAYQKRNMALVDNCTELWAYYDGRSKSGTKNCIKYAEQANRKVINIYGIIK